MRVDRRRILRVACLLPAAAPIGGVTAQVVAPPQVLFDPGVAASVELSRALRFRLGSITALSRVQELRAGATPPFVVAIGADALSAIASERPRSPVLALLVSRQAFERITSASPTAFPVTAIYAEPAPDHQMRIVRALFRRRITLGILVSEASVRMSEALQQAAATNDLSLHIEAFDAGAGLARSLSRIADANAVLIFPDAAIYSRQNLRELLEVTYRRRQPVFGFSEALVSAGTLASAVSDAHDIAAQAASMAGVLTAGRRPPAQYPRFWRVAVNESVARSLDIVVDAAVRIMGDRP